MFNTLRNIILDSLFKKKEKKEGIEIKVNKPIVFIANDYYRILLTEGENSGKIGMVLGKTEDNEFTIMFPSEDLPFKIQKFSAMELLKQGYKVLIS
jgi:hypothetical protein